jgi:hypothetical protein
VNRLARLGLLIISASPVLTVAGTPDEDETRTRPWLNMALAPPVLPYSSFMVELGITSTRPSFPRETTALEPLAVVTVLPEEIAEFSFAG